MEMEIFFPGRHARRRPLQRLRHLDRPARTRTAVTRAPRPPSISFMASIGTCAGVYVLGFLQQRGLSTEGAGVVMTA